MEDDRAQTNLSEAVEAECVSDVPEKAKQPKKRFVGRKAAAQKTSQDGGSNETMDDGGAIQGLESTQNHTSAFFL